MIAFRKAHPSLARSRFWRDDPRWYGVGRSPDFAHDSHSLALALHGASEGDDDLYVMINAYWEQLAFEIQEGTGGGWSTRALKHHTTSSAEGTSSSSIRFATRSRRDPSSSS